MVIIRHIFILAIAVAIGGCYKPSIGAWEAARTGDTRAVVYYLKQGAYKSSRDNDGNTLVWYVFSHGPAAPGMIWEYREDLDTYPFEHNWNFYLFVVISEKIKTDRDAEMFVSSFSDNALKASAHDNPLYYCVMLGKYDLVKKLIKRGADVNSKFITNSTILHSLNRGEEIGTPPPSGDDLIKMNELLISSGADVNARSNNGFTPLDCTNMNPYSDNKLIAFLRKHGAKTGDELDAEKK